MQTPVLASDGWVYERAAIEQWLRQHRTSPMTNAPLPSRQLTPNHNLRSAIQEWRVQHPAYR